MTSKPITPCHIALDLHGLVVDHRQAKFEYFRDVLQVPYSHVLLNRAEIIAELAESGYDKNYYFAALETFFRSPYANQRTVVHGVAQFLQNIPTAWTITLVTTGRYNTEDSVRAELLRLGLPIPERILVASDEERINMLAMEGVIAYFDDKPDRFTEAASVGMLTVQVNDLRYNNRGVAVNFFFENWQQVLNSLPHLIDTFSTASNARE